MPFADVASRIKYPAKTSARFIRLDGLDRLREGTLYDGLRIPFTTEESGGQYIPMRERRPSIIWGGARMLADQLAGLMWGDEQMPIVRTYFGEEPTDADRKAEAAIQHLVESLNLDEVMDLATERASSGSAAIIVRSVGEDEPYIEVLPGKECQPTFDPHNPMKLVKLEQLYPTTGQALVDMGYEIPEDEVKDDYWLRLVIDDTEETRYLPLRADKYERLGERDLNGETIRWVKDDENSSAHGWPVIPVVWVKAPKGGRIDGACLYEPIKDILVEIDYALSQVSRGYRYTADPMLMIRRGELRNGAMPASTPKSQQTQTQKDAKGRIIKSPTNVLDIEAGGDAKMLEINGQGLEASGEFIKLLREWGLEICGGMKSDASTTKGVESGRALEILYQALILVLKRWRVALGNRAFLSLVRLLLTGLQNGVITVDGVENVDPDTTMRLVWPEWMTPAGADLNQTASAWQTLIGASATNPQPILPRSAVTKMAAMNLGLTDTTALLKELDQQQTEDDSKQQEQAEQQHDQALELQQAKAKPAPSKAK